MKTHADHWGRGERGQALFLVMVATVLIMLVASAFLQVSQLNGERASSNRKQEQLTNAARVGVAQAKHVLWESYRNWLQGAPNNLPANNPGTLTTARDFLENFINAETGWAANLPPNTTVANFLASRTGDAVTGISHVGEKIWVQVEVERQDPTTKATFIRVRSVATSWNPALGDRAARAAAGLPADQRVVETVFRFGGALFDGFRFALLANAVNCTFCHADIDNSHRIYNTDPTALGTFERVRVATLESLEFRGSVDTYIAGALYAQGALIKQDGTSVTAANLAGYGLQSATFSTTDGVLAESGTVATNPETRLSKTNFVDPPKTAGEYTQPYANFYKDYNTATKVDGPLPETFPPVIADDGGPTTIATEAGNRIVDDSEWNAHVSNFNGTVTITGGAGGASVLIDHNSNETYAHSSLPDGTGGSGKVETAAIPQGGTSNNSVILVGTASDPIEISGDVAIDGDLVISGYVKGKGQFLARNNIYILGDLQYLDGTDGSGNRTFGVAGDATENVVAYAAGGAIVHGEYLLGDNRYGGIEGGDKDAGDSTAPSFAMHEISLWNRMEVTKTLPYYDAAKQRPTLDPGPTGSPNGANSGYIPGYKPRFYTYREHDQAAGEGKIWINGYGSDYSDWAGTQQTWNNAESYWAGETLGSGQWKSQSLELSDLINGMNDQSNGASAQLKADLTTQSNGKYATLAFDPKGEWMTQADFRAIQGNQDSDRQSNGGARAFQLDGLFYTNNAMSFLSGRSSSGNKQIEFNGSVVAADTGIFGPNGIKIHYDVRTRDHLKIEDTSAVEFYSVVEREGIE